MFRIRSTPKFHAPTEELAIESWLDPKGGLRIEHPFQSQRDSAWGGERHEMAWDNHACIPVGTSFMILRRPINHSDLEASSCGIIRRAKTDHPRSDDQNIFHDVRMPQQS